MKPIFGSKLKSRNIIALLEGAIIIQEKKKRKTKGKLPKTFNELFVSVVKILESKKIFPLLLPLRQKLSLLLQSLKTTLVL